MLTPGDGIALCGVLFAGVSVMHRILPNKSTSYSVTPDCETEHKKLLDLVRAEMKLAVLEGLTEWNNKHAH
jgi:hypothetical protein